MIEVTHRHRGPGYENNASFLNYSQQSETGIDLVLAECGYERCDPNHYWEGYKNFHVIHVVLSGCGTLTFAGKVYCLHPGEIFYIPPDKEVSYQADENEPWEYRWVGLVGTKAVSTLNQTTLPKTVCAAAGHADQMADRMKKIYECAIDGSAQSALLALGHAYFFLAELLDEFGKQKKEENRSEEYVQRATEYIQKNYTSDISVEGICRQLHISRSYLYKLFQHCFGQSPSNYVIRLRLEKAKELLSTQQYAVNEVAEHVGFSDHAYFTKRFRMAYGMTPREYVKNPQEEKE